MTRRTGTKTLTAVAAATLALAVSSGSASAQEQTVVIGASSVGGSYYLYAGGLSGFLSENSDLMRVTAQTTRGSVENVRLLDVDRLEFGLSNAAVVYGHREGIGQFEDAASDQIRGVAILDIAPSHWVTEEGSGVTSFEDLAGNRVSLGAPGSGTANTAELVLEAVGILDDVDTMNFGFSESADNLRDGHLEAFAASSAIPMPAIVDLATTRNVRLLSMTDDMVAAIQEVNPAYDAVTIPGGTYGNFDEDVVTVGVPSTLVTRANMDEEIVYELTRLMHSEEALSHMQDIYSAWNPEPGQGLFDRIGVPLHPGAEAFYRDQGLID